MAEQDSPVNEVPEEEVAPISNVGSRLLDAESIDEIIDFVNKYANKYVSLVLDNEEITTNDFVSKESMDDETVNDLYFAMAMLLGTEYGEKHKDKIVERGDQMYEPIQYEFRRRAQFPDVYNPVDAMNL